MYALIFKLLGWVFMVLGWSPGPCMCLASALQISHTPSPPGWVLIAVPELWLIKLGHYLLPPKCSPSLEASRKVVFL